jgi:hypothetical protein
LARSNLCWPRKPEHDPISTENIFDDLHGNQSFPFLYFLSVSIAVNRISAQKNPARTDFVEIERAQHETYDAKLLILQIDLDELAEKTTTATKKKLSRLADQ